MTTEALLLRASVVPFYLRSNSAKRASLRAGWRAIPEPDYLEWKPGRLQRSGALQRGTVGLVGAVTQTRAWSSSPRRRGAAVRASKRLLLGAGLMLRAGKQKKERMQRQAARCQGGPSCRRQPATATRHAPCRLATSAAQVPHIRGHGTAGNATTGERFGTMHPVGGQRTR